MVRRTYRGRKKISRRSKSRRNVSRRRLGRNRKLAGGGVRYGSGVGANCNDPNQSIFNTNLLKLFPYKP
jgi:hypothetical protein